MARSIRNKPGLSLLTGLLNHPVIPVLYRQTRLIETLAFEEVRSPNADKPYTHTAFVLHGLLGSGRNWRSFSRLLAKNLSASNPPSEWRMVLVDLRNHGKSAELQGLLPPHDIPNAAKDLSDLVNSQAWDWPDVVIGHSMGGKVALQYAQGCARGDYGDSVKLPKQLWILDSIPGIVSPESSDGEVEKVLKTLQGLPSTVPSRKWLVNHMTGLGFSKSLSDWIGSNLKKVEEGETWAFNLEGAVQMFNSYRETDCWPILEQTPKETGISIVRAENSDRWDCETVQRLDALASRKDDGATGKVSVHILPRSGHWVHVDNPKGLLDIVTPHVAALV